MEQVLTLHLLTPPLETSEGLDRKLALNYYSRMRFAQNLLPQLNNAAKEPNSVARVLSVLGAGNEGKLIEDDLELKRNYSLMNSAAHSTTMTGLAFEHLAKENPNISFLHCFPGGVNTNVAKRMGGVTGWLMQTAMKSFLLKPWMVPLEESGERHLYAATAPAFAARSVASLEAIAGIDGVKNSGAYLVGADGEPTGKMKLINGLREKGMTEKVWEHTLQIFRRAEQ